jgi:sec-independent protein translocase protein TatA
MFDGSFHLAFIGPGGPEFLVVMLVLLMMFGAKDAPRILRKLNEIISQIRNTADGFKREVMYGDLNTDTPTYTPSDSTEESDHDDDHTYEDDYGGDEYYDYGEDNGGDGEEFKEMVDDMKAEDSLNLPPDSDVPDDEDGDAPKT